MSYLLQSEDEWYYVQVLEEEVPNPYCREACSEFEFENRSKKQWWYNFCDGINEGDDESLARIVNYDTQNFFKLEALTSWCDHDTLLQRLYNL